MKELNSSSKSNNDGNITNVSATKTFAALEDVKHPL